MGGRRIWILGAACLLGGVAGCARSPADRWTKQRPPTHRVVGTVTLAGAPVEGATVIFEAADQPLAAVGRTDGRGRFALRTFVPGDGAIAGRHRVRIEKMAEPPQALGPDGGPPPVAMPALPVSLLPARYAAFETSGLEAVVDPAGRNEFDFDMAAGGSQRP
jgi:hypothetical protein